MTGLELVAGVGILCFLVLFIAFNLDEEHYLLKLLCVFFFLGLMLLIPKATIDYSNHCDFVQLNSTVTGNTTAYSYDYLCTNSTTTTPQTFYQSTTWILRIFLLYFAAYIIYFVFQKVQDRRFLSR